MFSSESHSAMYDTPQPDRSAGTASGLRDRVRLPQPRKSAHSSDYGYACQRTKSHLAHLLHSPERRTDDACRPLSPPAKEVVHAKEALQSPRELVAAPRHIPPEILGIVFENCLDEQQGPSRAVLSEYPLLLSHVCSYWRSVALNTPRLWTSLSLRFLETNVDRSRDGVKVAAAVDTWLLRSYPAPLSITFTDHRIFRKDTEDVVVWLLSHIRTHASRWKAIHLKFSSDYFIRLAALSASAFTSLTSFSVHTDHMGWRHSLLSLHLDLTHAYQLTSLAYTGPDHVVREDILVDWTRLTSIALSYDLHEAGGGSTTLPRHFSTLVLCQNLTELSIGLSTTLAQHLQQLDAAAQEQSAIPIVELPRLHTLRVRRLSRSVHACALLDALCLPKLSTLYIDSAVLVGWDGTHTLFTHPDVHHPLPPLLDAQMQTPTTPTAPWWHAHHFSALLERSACHLHALHIRDVDMSPLELARLLTSPSTSPTLATFTFEPCPRTSLIADVLAHLIPFSVSAPSPSLGSIAGPPTRPAFPSLTALRLNCAHESHLGPLATIIETRTGPRALAAGVRPLAVFELIFHDYVYSLGQAAPEWRKVCFWAFRERVLRCAREGGVDVDIRVERPYEPVYLSVPLD